MQTKHSCLLCQPQGGLEPSCGAFTATKNVSVRISWERLFQPTSTRSGARVVGFPRFESERSASFVTFDPHLAASVSLFGASARK